jgi:hypothetical protein
MCGLAGLVHQSPDLKLRYDRFGSIVLKKSILLSSTVLMDWFWIDAHVDWLESSDVGGCEPLSQYRVLRGSTRL